LTRVSKAASGDAAFFLRDGLENYVERKEKIASLINYYIPIQEKRK